MILEFRVHLVSAHDRAQCRRADSDEVLPDRSSLVHGVEGRDATDVSSSEAQDLSTRLDTGRRHPALDALHQVQHWQQRRASLRIPLRNQPQLLQRRLGDLGRSDAILQAGLIEVGHKVPMPNKLLRRNVPASMPVRRWRLRLNELTHRSTPPITGSRLATATTTSETMAPS